MSLLKKNSKRSLQASRLSRGHDMKKGFTLIEAIIAFLILLAFVGIIAGAITGGGVSSCPPGSEETTGWVNGSYIHTCTTITQ